MVQGIVAVIALLLLAGGAYVISQKQKNNNSVSNTTSEKVTGVSTDVPSNWKTYTNSRNGYEVKYPANWKAEENLGVSVNLINPVRQGKDDTDQPTEHVTISFEQTPCKESSWTIGFADIYYGKACVSSGKGQIATINSAAFDEQGKNIEEKIISSFKYTSAPSSSTSSSSDWKTYQNQNYGFTFQYPTKGYTLSTNNTVSAGFNTIVSVNQSPAPIEFGASFSIGVKNLSSRPSDLEQYAKTLFGNSFIDAKWVSVQMQDWLKVRTKDDYFEKEVSVNYFALHGNQIYRIYYFPIGSPSESDFSKIFTSFKFTGTPQATDTIKPTLTVTGLPITGNNIYPGSRVPFLNFTIKAGGKDVTIDSFIIQKKGTLRTNALTKIILFDNNGVELAQGTPFNQYDSSNIIKPITIKAGETKTFWLHAWMASDLSAADKNQYATLAISAINPSDWQNTSVLGNWAVTSNNMVVNLLEDTTPAPVLNSIYPSSGSIGTEFTLSGQNLNGFEGTTYLTLVSQSGQKGVIGVNSYSPQGVTTLKFVLPSSMCTVSLGESGKPCPSYFVVTPGSYQIYAQPWSKQSNALNLTITASNSQSITVSSPAAGSVLRVGQPYSITWTGHWERGDEVFSINTFPTNSDVYGTIATVPFAQASCSGNGMGHWADPVTCHYVWTPTYSTPNLRIGVFNSSNGNDFGYSGTFSITQ